jgi:carbamoyl-phosphate synthase large subunit
VREGSPNLFDLLRRGEIQLVINTPTLGRSQESDGFLIRRAAAEHGVPCLTSLDTARAVTTMLAALRERGELGVEVIG